MLTKLKWKNWLLPLALGLGPWFFGSKLGVDATETSFIAVVILLLTGVITTKDLLNESFAWNILTWLSIIMLMSKKLMTLGFFPWLSKALGVALKGMNWIWVLVILFLVYFYLHYLFPSIATQISVLYAGFLSIALGAGVPKLMVALMLAFCGSIFLSTSTYSAGPAAMRQARVMFPIRLGGGPSALATGKNSRDS